MYVGPTHDTPSRYVWRAPIGFGLATIDHAPAAAAGTENAMMPTVAIETKRPARARTAPEPIRGPPSPGTRMPETVLPATLRRHGSAEVFDDRTAP